MISRLERLENELQDLKAELEVQLEIARKAIADHKLDSRASLYVAYTEAINDAGIIKSTIRDLEDKMQSFKEELGLDPKANKEMDDYIRALGKPSL